MPWPITAAEVRAELRWPAHQGDAEDLELRARAAVERIEEEIGPHCGQTITARARGPVRTVVLPDLAASLTDVSAGGAALALDAFTLDPEAGIVSGPFPRGDITVTATAPTGVPAVVELAAAYLAATWVRQSKIGPPRTSARAGDPDTDVAQGFAMPRRVSEMIRPYTRVWGFA